MPRSLEAAIATLLSAALIDASPMASTPVLNVPLSGAAELNFAHPEGETGDPDGVGSVRIRISPDERQVCYDFQLEDVSTPMLAYIHHAPDGRIGPPVVGLFYGVGSELSGCVPANSGRLSDILANPSLYYVSIATTEFPDGALRGQIART